MTRRTSTPERTTRKPTTRSPLDCGLERAGDGATSTSVWSEPPADNLARRCWRSVTVMGSSEIGCFACGLGAVDSGVTACLRWTLREGTLMTAPSHGEPPPDTPCPCGHSADEHDPIASRYCRATVEGGLSRGCMCVPAPVPLGRYGSGR